MILAMIQLIMEIIVASCACNQTESELTLCSGSTTSPCDCSITLDCKVSLTAHRAFNINYLKIILLQCQPPFIGNGVWCTMDSDADDYPDKPLESFICKEPDEASMKYCKAVQCLLLFSCDGFSKIFAYI